MRDTYYSKKAYEDFKKEQPKDRELKFLKNLSDADVKFCRENITKYSYAELASMFYVSVDTMKKCVRGESYAHLNKKYIPWNEKPKPTKKKTGPKPLLTDEQAIYARQQAATKHLSVIAKELRVSRIVIVNCVKGRTFKHLNEIAKPQF